MRYCIPCRAELEDRVDRCPDCGAPLVDRAQYDATVEARRSELEEPFEQVCVLESRAEADVVVPALEAEGIRPLVRRFEDTAFDGLYVKLEGWAALFVARHDADRARALVQGLRASASPPAGPEGSVI